MTISRFDSFLFNKYLILRLIVFLSLIILNSPSFSAPNYSGDCSFYISRNGVKFEQAGYAFMTYKRDNKALKVRGNISLSKRHIIGTTHTAIYNDNTSINAKTGDQAVLEIKNEINSNKLLVQCGDITFNVERNTLASKPLISGLKQVSSTSTQECITSGDDPEFSVFERGIIRQGCDLSVYEIDLSSIKQNGKSATPDVLDKIKGFAPLFLDRKDEFNSALILDKETGKYISCPISHSMRGSITMQCKDKNKLDSRP